MSSMPWLFVIGIGEEGWEGLSPQGRLILERVTLCFGATRHRDLLPKHLQEKVILFPTPLVEFWPLLAQRRFQETVVLASGDPLWHGIGATLLTHYPAEEICIIPQTSAFSLAAARMRWPLAATTLLSLHAHPCTTLLPFLAPRRRILALSRDAQTPFEVANLLCTHGYGASLLTSLAHMSGPREEIHSVTAETWTHSPPDFHTLALELHLSPGTTPLPRGPGLPDEAFIHDGNITKRDIRTIALSKLMPFPGHVLWDIGAGCGSVSIEWMRCAENTLAYAIEPNPARRGFLAENARQFGVPRLEIHAGSAPEVLSSLPPPDAIFVGGGVRRAGVLETALAALSPGGRLVAHAVTLEGEIRLSTAFQRWGGSLIRLSVTQAKPLHSKKLCPGPTPTAWQTGRPVLQWSIIRDQEEKQNRIKGSLIFPLLPQFLEEDAETP